MGIDQRHFDISLKIARLTTMTETSATLPKLRRMKVADIRASLVLGANDFRAAPFLGFFFASFFVMIGIAIAAITYWTGQTFWLVLAVLGFPMVGSLASIGFYEISRQRSRGVLPKPRDVIRFVWSCRRGQIPWLAAIIVVIFLFWFFIGHMIFALFLGLTPMTNISTSFSVFASQQGAMMLVVGTSIGALFSALVFAISIHGLPMLVDRDIDFITAMITSCAAISKNVPVYFLWACFVALVSFLSVLSFFLGLFVSLPILGHATWHLYARLSDSAI